MAALLRLSACGSREEALYKTYTESSVRTQRHCARSTQLIRQISKEQLAEAARLVALANYA